MLNNVVLQGRITKTPELKFTPQSVPVCSFSLAVERNYQKDGNREADFIDCVSYRKTAEFVSQYFQKGQMMIVTGSLKKRSWRTQDGQTRYATEVIVDSAYFADSKRDDNQSAAPVGVPQGFTPVQGQSDDDLPF